jgi:RNA polymerase sigma factor (sigma-70 family)
MGDAGTDRGDISEAGSPALADTLRMLPVQAAAGGFASSDLLPASEVPVAMIDLESVAVLPAEPLGPPSFEPALPSAPAATALAAARFTPGIKPTFEQLYVANYQALVRLAFVLTGSLELSEDLVQDCFVRLHRHYERLEAPERYAKQAVVNACRSHFRALGRERDRRPLLYVVEDSDVSGPAGVMSGELNDMLLALPYRQRAAIVLRYFAGLSELEIAEVLGCRPGTVGSLVHRALERLRRAIEP